MNYLCFTKLKFIAKSQQVTLQKT